MIHYLKKHIVLIFVVCIGTLGKTLAQIDTIRLYAGGPSYVISHKLLSSKLNDCGDYLTDSYYQGAAYNAGVNGKKKGDNYVWQTLTANNYAFSSTDFPIRQGNPDKDTILPKTMFNGEVQLLRTTLTQNLNIYVFAEIASSARSWVLISCRVPDTTRSIVKRYLIIVEERPKTLTSLLRVCNYASPMNLYSNIDKTGGVFYYAPKGGTFKNSSTIPNGVFNPSKYENGTYTIFYYKPYLNDTSKSLAASFNIEVYSLPLSIKATPNEIWQGEHVSFEPSLILPKEDSIISSEWDYGDQTTLSKLVKPFHYYLDSGAMTVSLKLVTKNGCRQSTVLKSAVYVNNIPFEVTTDTKPPGLESYYNTIKNDTRFYPNPSTGLFHFSAYNALENVQVVVSRISDGVCVYDSFYKNLKTLDVDLQQEGAGMFTCIFKHPNGRQTKYKLIKL